MMKLITSLIREEEIVLTDYVHSEDISCINICGKSENGKVTFLNGMVVTDDLDLAYRLKHAYGLSQANEIDAMLCGAGPGDIMFHGNDFKRKSSSAEDLKNMILAFGLIAGTIMGGHAHDA